MLSNVDIIRSDGNLLQAPINNDGIAGLIYYGTSGVSSLQAKLNTPEDAISNGIPDTTELYYHISEYFRLSNYPLYVKVVNSAPTLFTEVKTLKDFASGEIRILGVLNKLSVYNDSAVTGLQAIAEECEAEFEPLQIIYSALYSGSTNSLTTLYLDAPRVSVVIGEDLSGRASALRTKSGNKSISSLGSTLGAVSISPVHESIGYVLKNNIRASEHSEIGFINGSKLTDTSKTLQNTLDNYRYIFLRKFEGLAGVYHNADYSAVDPFKSDFSRICYNRVYDKAYRNLRSTLIPHLQSNSYFDKSGRLSAGTVKFFETICSATLQQMKDAGEISDYIVQIDPNQNILQTETLKIVAKIQPAGINHMIQVTLGFTKNI